MAKTDVDLIEEIGENLEKKNEENAAESEELRSAEVVIVADDVIEENDEDMRERINRLIAKGEFIQFSVKDLERIIQPEPDEDGNTPLGKYQFRRIRENYDDLKADIALKGITKYIILKREVDDFDFVSYHTLDGNTRLKILKELLAEDPEFPIPTFIVLDCSDADATLIAKNYNEFSENLDSEDDQYAVIRSIEVGGITQAEAARRYDYSESYVSDIVAAFQKVPEEVREMIESRQLTVKHGTELARLQEYPKKQKSLAKKAYDKYFGTSKLREEVSKELLRIGYLDDAAKVIDEVAGKHSTPGLEVGQKTKSEVLKIHEDLQKKFGKRESEWSNKMIFKGCTGGITIGPTKGATESVLKKAGYKIVEDPPVDETKSDGEGPMIALMPSEEELINARVCRFCGGSINTDVAEKFGFDANYAQHIHCDIIDDIQRAQAGIENLTKRLDSYEKKLKKEKISTILEKKGITLEQFNKEAAEVYAEVLREKKKEWFEANIPLAKLKESDPDLVPEHYWPVIEKFLRQDEGFETQTAAASQVGEKGVARKSFERQLKKVRQALAKVEVELVEAE